METFAIPNVAAFTAQVCIIVLAGALLLRLLHIASAGTRYFCWRLVLAVCLAMPLLLQRTVPQVIETPQATLSLDVLAPATSGESTATLPSPGSTPTPRPWGFLAAAVIVAGAMARAAWLTVGLVRLGALRRRGVPIHDDDDTEMQALLGTDASLRSVNGLTQPVTFGVWRPVVLLPETLATAPRAIRRAVVTHELFHVQRRDWCWVIVEEMLRAAFWFHPAILWVTSRIQLAREELVDELTVLATGNRKAYIEALLAFADAGRVRPAPAFARRRQLFTRIIRLSKERVMSSPRILVSAGIVIAAVLGTGWYASLAFPIVAAAPAPVAPIASAMPLPAPAESVRAGARQQFGVQRPGGAPVAAVQGPRSGGAPRQPRPVTAVPPVQGTKPITPENPIPRRLSSVAAAYPAQLKGSGYRASIALQVTVDASGSISDVRRMGVEVGGGDAADPTARGGAVEAFFNAAIDAVRQWRYQAPADPPIAFFVTARFDGDRDAVTAQTDRPEQLGRGGAPIAIATTDLNRGRLLVGERQVLELRTERARLAAQFGEQDARVVNLNRRIGDVERAVERTRAEYENSLRVAQAQSAAAAGTGARVAGPGATTLQPLRVGGNIKPPMKTRQVDPEYPEIAKSARVQGVVIMEATIDEQGRVVEARVLRSIPLLDQAALDAVSQWEFTPTLLNGAPVPVIMTMTIQFTLPPQ